MIDERCQIVAAVGTMRLKALTIYCCRRHIRELVDREVICPGHDHVIIAAPPACEFTLAKRCNIFNQTEGPPVLRPRDRTMIVQLLEGLRIAVVQDTLGQLQQRHLCICGV